MLLVLAALLLAFAIVGGLAISHWLFLVLVVVLIVALLSRL
jgi:hypothetical protein